MPELKISDHSVAEVLSELRAGLDHLETVLSDSCEAVARARADCHTARRERGDLQAELGRRNEDVRELGRRALAAEAELVERMSPNTLVSPSTPPPDPPPDPPLSPVAAPTFRACGRAGCRGIVGELNGYLSACRRCESRSPDSPKVAAFRAVIVESGASGILEAHTVEKICRLLDREWSDRVAPGSLRDESIVGPVGAGSVVVEEPAAGGPVCDCGHGLGDHDGAASCHYVHRVHGGCACSAFQPRTSDAER